MTPSADPNQRAAWDAQRAPVLHARQFATPTEQAVIDRRLGSGLLALPGPRDYLISLAIDAGYSFTQIALLLRSGRGDERADLLGGAGAPDGAEPLDEQRRRLVG